MVANSLRVRRPVGPGANPQAGPGGIDSQSHPLPDEHWDCRRPLAVFEEKLKLSEVRKCLASIEPIREKPEDIGEIRQIRYRLWRAPEPYLYLEDSATAPDCLNEVMAKIPIPREIVFLIEDDVERTFMKNQYVCYSIRLPVEADLLGTVRIPTHKFVLSVNFPLDNPPQDDAATNRLLTSWMTTPFFWIEEQGLLKARYFPESYCRACYNDKDVLKQKGPKRLQWPLKEVEVPVEEEDSEDDEDEDEDDWNEEE